MMIKYSWKKINNRFEWNPQSVIEYFYCKRNIKPQFFLRRIPKKKVEIEARKPFPQGECFIVNLDEALRMADSANHLFIYLELASKRNLFDYKLRGVTHLSMQLVPEYLMGVIETNPMLEVKDENLYFKYEQR